MVVDEGVGEEAVRGTGFLLLATMTTASTISTKITTPIICSDSSETDALVGGVDGWDARVVLVEVTKFVGCVTVDCGDDVVIMT